MSIQQSVKLVLENRKGNGKSYSIRQSYTPTLHRSKIPNCVNLSCHRQSKNLSIENSILKEKSGTVATVCNTKKWDDL